MKKPMILVLCACLLVAIVAITVIAADSNIFSNAGTLQKKAAADISSGDGEIAAIYKDQIIYYSQLEHDMALGAWFNGTSGEQYSSDRKWLT